MARLELFGPGPPSPAAEQRISSHVAVSKGRAILWPPQKKKPEWIGSPEAHSGLSVSEMLIPLVIAQGSR